MSRSRPSGEEHGLPPMLNVVHLARKKGEYQRVHRFGKGREVTSAVAPKVTVRVAALF